MKIIKQWPVFFLLLAFAISPLFQGVQPDVLVVIHILVLVVFFKVFLDSYQKLRIPYNSVSISIFLFYLWMALSISWSPAPSITLHIFVWLSIFPICYFFCYFSNQWQRSNNIILFGIDYYLCDKLEIP